MDPKDPYRAAKLLIDRHGKNAKSHAMQRVLDMRASGDERGEWVWMGVLTQCWNCSPADQPKARGAPEGEPSIIRLDHALSLIEHDGRMYDLAGLVRHLSPQEMRDVDAAAPRSGQAL